MIIITGAAGFIGSCLLTKLQRQGFDVVAVDDFNNLSKAENIKDIPTEFRVDRRLFFDWLDKNSKKVSFIFHLGARTDTTEFDWKILEELNLNYSKQLWGKCVKYEIPLVYASSAATYGGGELGYDDNEKLISTLKPLNPYGESKNLFDIWVLEQTKKPPFWAGLKFFNVYGPNEYHKGRMASVVFHAYNQIKVSNKVKLFRSHNPQYKDGEQIRDFIYVKDILSVCCFLMNHQLSVKSGIYNLGSGKARTFLDLVNALFTALNNQSEIEFTDIPNDIRDKYQYFTEASMTKLVSMGYNQRFTSLEDGVKDYAQNYLLNHLYY